MRLTVSEVRTHMVSSCATDRRSSSPNRCPSESLIDLKSVDIEEEDRQRPMMATGERKRAGQPVGQHQAVREIGQWIVARQMGELPCGLVGPPPEGVLPQQRVAEHLQQLSVEHQPSHRDRLFRAHHGPQFLEGRAALAGEPRDCHRFTKSDRCVAAHDRAHDVAVAQKRDADHGQPRHGDDDRGPVVDRTARGIAGRIRRTAPGS